MTLISPGHAARIYNTTTATLARWRRRGTGPAYFRLTPLVIRYATDDLHDWFTNPGQPAPTPPPASPTQAPDR